MTPVNSPANTVKNGCGPLAVLRRAKNVKNASDTERNALLGCAERIETWCANLVLGAIVLEAVVWVAPLCPSLFKLGNFIADAAVAIGIYGEVRFGHIAGDILKMRLAEATERASAAELETERLKARFSWRRLSAEQIEKFAGALADKQRLSIRIEYVGDDPETNLFAREIGSLFKKSGWNVGFTSASYAGAVAFGLRLPLYAPPNLEACGIARIALKAASIEFSGSEPPRWFMGSGSGDSISVGSPCAHLYVGPKPAPPQESSETDQPAETPKMTPEEAKEMLEGWRSRLRGNEPVMTWPIDSPLTITREDDGTVLIDCRNFRLAGMEDEVGIARFRVSPDAVNELSQYFSSLGKREDEKQQLESAKMDSPKAAIGLDSNQ
jgi:hypothetical protein